MRNGGISLGLSVVLLAGIALEVAAQNDPKYRYRVREDKLLRRSSTIVIRAIETPGLNDPGATKDFRAITLRDLSVVGANGVCFELRGFDDNATEIGEEYVRALSAAVREINYRHIGIIIKVFGDYLPDLHDWRLRAARTAGRTLRDFTSAVYVFDGPRADELAKAFKEEAPDLVVAAPGSGDVELVKKAADASGKRPAVVFGELTSEPSQVSCVLPGNEETYERFETAMAYPEEKEGWTPDNSILTAKERKEGWIALFDGKTFNGWIQTGSNPNGWKIEDGVIKWGGPGGGYLRTIDRYDDFHLKLEWKIRPRGNSGIMIRTPRANRFSKMGFEFQLQGDHGRRPTKNTTGAIYDVIAPPKDATKEHGEWNAVEIILDGTIFKAWLNGEKLHDMNFEEHPEMRLRLRRGFLALQDHGRYVEFRNIRLKEL